ncbi:LysR family transcriptional regulator [Vibrio sp. VPAP30]|uniref:LysR family transcriptional regulator n=1 Tax=Vibrio sp. VPAP30 TaxID=1647102 RepID=UPI00065840DA|nr:LysR family transcriptional regulator [Vibrio sp. VPAP30]KLN63420.1 transcriptional regulator [Vibrio sp. VPAP30]
MIEKDLNLLKFLKVLSEEKQTVLAAKQLKISQPTVSAMLKKLRVEFDDNLFIRNKNILEPTPRCEEILAQLPELFERLDNLYLDKDSWDISSVEGDIQIFLPSPLIDIIAPSLVNKLCISAPNATVECSVWTENTVRQLEQSPNAWGVCYEPVQSSKNLIGKLLYEDRFMLVMREDHPIQNNQLSEVSQYPVCVTIIPGFAEGSRMEMFIKRYKLEKKISARVSNMSLMFELLQDSDFIGSTSRLHTKCLPSGIRTMATPPEVNPKILNKNLSFFSSQRNRNNPIADWLYEEIKTIIDALV